MIDNSSQVIEDIKWFLFDDVDFTFCNDFGFKHNLEFVCWCGDGNSFICKDCDGQEYRINISKEDI